MSFEMRLKTVLLLAWTVMFRSTCAAVVANAWHIPDNTADLGFTMRNPEFELGTNTTVTIYQGVQKYNNPYGTANQTGGTVYYKGAGQIMWLTNGLNFYLNGGPSPNNQYWSASFNTTNFASDEVIQYYILVTFDGANGLENTYVYGGDGRSSTSGSEASAQAAPFTIRNRAAWLFHNNNRVINPGADSSHKDRKSVV